MKTVEKNTTFNIFYSGKNRQSGLTVSFDIWDDSAGVRGSSISATEIGSKGVYKASFTAPNENLYLLIKGTDGSQSSAMVVQVGAPATRKAFHNPRFFETGQTISYAVYDESETILQSGNLTEITAGFYSADISALTVPFYFRVSPLTDIVK